MENYKKIAIGVMIVGLVAGLISLLADPIDLGGDTSTFGYYQILGTIVGIVLVIAGGFFFYRGGRFMKSKTGDKEEKDPSAE